MYFEGYLDERFNSRVSEDLHCPICRNVLKQPKQCKENEHHFCEQCIIGHLNVSRTCPMCKDYLSVESLKRPSRFVRNSLDNLEISCDNAGCKAVVRLGELNTHTENCDHVLVTCKNHGCGRKLKRKDLGCHEKAECIYRVIHCAECLKLTNKLFIYKLLLFSMLLVFLGYCLESVMSVA